MAEKVRYDWDILAEAAYTGYVYSRKIEHPEMAINWSEYKHLSHELQKAWISAAKAMFKAAKSARK